MVLKTSLTRLLLVASTAWAHPGGHEKVYAARSLDHCSKEFSKAEFVKRTVEIHGEEYARLRRALSLESEDTNKTGTKATDPVSLFTESSACVLTPAVDQGPLYVLGEQVRKDITEGEAGIKMTLAIQVVDYKTCSVVPDAYVDIWSSNSTGTYVGVQGYPGMGHPKDASILKGTALRGVQLSDSHGVATFDTLLPGHYDGRATHVHAIVYLGATKQPNNTITGGHAAHVGQLYFDQSLLANVDKVAPYSSNKMTVVKNTADYLFQQGANGDDPIVRYSLVGSKLEDGVFAWIRFGVDTKASKSVNPAAFWTANGGVMNPTGPVALLTGSGWGGWGKLFKKSRQESE